MFTLNDKISIECDQRAIQYLAMSNVDKAIKAEKNEQRAMCFAMTLCMLALFYCILV